MSLRTTYLVAYDISSPARLRKVFEVCKAFGEHLQLSVFRCDLSPADLIRLKMALNEVLHMRQDQVLFVNVGPLDGRSSEAFETLGRALDERVVGAKIV